ncbi:MAG: histidinol-phosphate transaminase [Bacilli bacterium]
MSKFFSSKYTTLTPYTPGEQPKEKKYIKLNTNENPYPPCNEVIKKVSEYASSLNLYSDPETTKLVKEICSLYNIDEDEVIFTNGSDEILNFAFMAFCSKEVEAAFPSITYGFYKVFASLNNVPYSEIPLNKNFSINVSDYIGINKTIFIANPNAPTGLCLKKEDIEQILISNPNNIVVIDEAYIDFALEESSISLIEKYPNLLVTQTFSKSRSLAGGRLGFGIGNKELINDLKTIKYSTNPYNINTLTLVAGVATLQNEEYTQNNIKKIIDERERVTLELRKLGFEVLPSQANFIFAKSDLISGKELYFKLKEKGILVRHFDQKEIGDYNRITIGTKEDNDALLYTTTQILKEVTL